MLQKVVPTVLRIDGLRVVVYPNDHRPAHVHVIRDGCEAVFNLNCPDGPPQLRENYGFSEKETGRIEAIVTENLMQLCREWRRIHGVS
jgi:hypothetical protein